MSMIVAIEERKGRETVIMISKIISSGTTCSQRFRHYASALLLSKERKGKRHTIYTRDIHLSLLYYPFQHRCQCKDECAAICTWPICCLAYQFWNSTHNNKDFNMCCNSGMPSPSPICSFQNAILMHSSRIC